jgi:hypothetical protein
MIDAANIRMARVTLEQAQRIPKENS